MNPRIRSLAAPAIVAAKAALALRTLHRLGHTRSTFSARSVERTGASLPWFTYPAIEYLRGLDLGGTRVFEFGAGDSTRYWVSRGASVTAVENDAGWHARVSATIGSRADIELVVDPMAYPEVFLRSGTDATIVVIDGIEREACARVVANHARDDAVIVLDNADWHERSDAILGGTGRLRVPFTGFGPVNPYTWTTAFYLPLGASVAAQQAQHPPIGGVAFDESAREERHRQRPGR
jgi:hypothetical protein